MSGNQKNLRRVRVTALTIALGVALAGCGKRTANEEEWLARGAEIVIPLKQDLKAALMKGMEKGPEEAIAVCQVQAPMIAARVGAEDVKVGRTSHKLRNPSNKPKPWMQPLLDDFVANPGAAGPRVVALDNDRIGYVEPIYVKAMCLTCHGQSITPGLAAAIDRWYPNDEGRGFAEGDFRGMFWAEFPRAHQEKG